MRHWRVFDKGRFLSLHMSDTCRLIRNAAEINRGGSALSQLSASGGIVRPSTGDGILIDCRRPERRGMLRLRDRRMAAASFGAQADRLYDVIGVMFAFGWAQRDDCHVTEPQNNLRSVAGC
jgi:hypothetical protein